MKLKGFVIGEILVFIFFAIITLCSAKFVEFFELKLVFTALIINVFYILIGCAISFLLVLYLNQDQDKNTAKHRVGVGLTYLKVFFKS